jgi:hypothetical protein
MAQRYHAAVSNQPVLARPDLVGESFNVWDAVRPEQQESWAHVYPPREGRLFDSAHVGQPTFSNLAAGGRLADKTAIVRNWYARVNFELDAVWHAYADTTMVSMVLGFKRVAPLPLSSLLARTTVQPFVQPVVVENGLCDACCEKVRAVVEPICVVERNRWFDVRVFPRSVIPPTPKVVGGEAAIWIHVEGTLVDDRPRHRGGTLPWAGPAR